MRWWAAELTNPAARFVGFDSFEGLPEDWRPSTPRGWFKTTGPPAIDDARVSFVTGWFDETLLGNDDLELLEAERENLRLALDFALRSDPELALSLAQWLMPSWLQRGESLEGRERLSAALAGAPDAPAPRTSGGS